MARFRSHGWEPKELKVYWNSQQLEDLCPKSDTDNSKKIEGNDEKEIQEEKTNVQANIEDLPEYDPSDADAVQLLRQNPVSNRNYECEIKYVHNGIERAVFDVPEDAQLIVLNFAVSFFF